jgi:hypothetical protein
VMRMGWKGRRVSIVLSASSVMEDIISRWVRHWQGHRILCLPVISGPRRVYCGMAKLAGKAQLTRRGLYYALSQKGTPEWSTLRSLVNALGYRIRLMPKKRDDSFRGLPHSNQHCSSFIAARRGTPHTGTRRKGLPYENGGWACLKMSGMGVHLKAGNGRACICHRLA